MHFPTVFFGTPEFAVPLLERLCAEGLAPGLVVTQPTKRRSRRGEPEPSPVALAAGRLGIDVLETEDTSQPDSLERIRAAKPALGIVVAFGQILRKSVLNLPRFGCINLHPSMLPKYRGAAPINWAILDGVTESGITVMRLVRKLDAGPILMQRPFRIPRDETADRTLGRAATEGASMLASVARQFAEGHPPMEVPQNDADATYAGMLSREHGMIDWSRTADRVWDQIRGVQPWPRAETHLTGSDGGRERLLIFHAEPMAGTGATGVPGEILAAGADGIVVCCGGGTRLLVTEIQCEGRRRMAVEQALNGLAVRPGDRFGR